jgi:molybdopterin-guanine dinucleotide biosynthesis protein A
MSCPGVRIVTVNAVPLTLSSSGSSTLSVSGRVATEGRSTSIVVTLRRTVTRPIPPACQTRSVEPRPPVPTYAVSVIVLTGGLSRRMGQHKPSLGVGGSPMVVRVLAAAAPRPVLVVGRADDVPDGIPVLVEEPPGGGPVAAVAAGLTHVPPSSEAVLVLAADLPFLTTGHLDRLVVAAAAPGTSGLAVSTDPEGRTNWMCSAWRRSVLAQAVEAVGDPVGASMRSLARGLQPVEVPDPDGLAVDVDTPEDLVRARAAVATGRPGRGDA